MTPRRFGGRRLTFQQADYQCSPTLGRPPLDLF
jgi:hypothetical protein